MADNSTLPATGDVIATDDIAGVKHQRVKVEYGADGSATDVSSTTPLPTLPTDGTSAASVFPGSFLRVSDEPIQIFYDPFDTALETTNYWTTPTIGTGATIATVTTGVATLATGTTAAGWSKLFSQPSFKPVVPGWLGYSFAISLPDLAAPTSNTYRFWGSGTPATTPTAAAPLTNAVGFELATDGKMYAVVYAGGVRTVIQDLSAATGNSKQPTDASYHRYIVYVRTDRSYWYIDGLGGTNLVATSSFQSPQVQSLPITMLAVANTPAPLATGTINCSGCAVWDTTKGSVVIADGTYGWREASVGKSGGLAVRGGVITGQSLAVVAATPVTGTGLDVSEAGNVTFIVKNTVAATAYTGAPVIVFEQSDDNVSWGPLIVVRGDTGLAGSTVTLSAGSSNGEIMFDAALEGVNYVRARVTTAQTLNGMTIVTQPGTLPFAPSVAVSAAPAITKGTQGTSGFMVQRLHDSGRNVTNYFHAVPIITTVAEVMQTLTGYKSGAAVVATATPAVVTAGKTYRITHVEITYIAATVIGSARVNLRANLSGAGVVGSPLVKSWQVGIPAVFTAGSAMTYSFDYPEGLEFPAGTGIAVGVIGEGAVPTTGTIAGYVLVSIEGYEY